MAMASGGDGWRERRLAGVMAGGGDGWRVRCERQRRLVVAMADGGDGWRRRSLVGAMAGGGDGWLTRFRPLHHFRDSPPVSKAFGGSWNLRQYTFHNVLLRSKGGTRSESGPIRHPQVQKGSDCWYVPYGDLCMITKCNSPLGLMDKASDF